MDLRYVTRGEACHDERPGRSLADASLTPGMTTSRTVAGPRLHNTQRMRSSASVGAGDVLRSFDSIGVRLDWKPSIALSDGNTKAFVLLIRKTSYWSVSGGPTGADQSRALRTGIGTALFLRCRHRPGRSP